MYKGLQSTDAEIILNFDKGTVGFDYSLNRFAKYMSSNFSCCLHDEPVLGKHYLIEILKGYTGAFLQFFVLPFTARLVEVYPKYQLLSQKLLKWSHEHIYGTIEESIIGKQETKTLAFIIECNLWFDYVLDGDYQDKIKKISLLRRFVKKTIFGKVKHQQQGWNVVFEFAEPPQHGYVTLRSMG